MAFYLSALAAGLLFAAGLALSGMTLPSKVIGFLDVFVDWDPALAFVMGGALITFGIGYRLVLGRRTRPLFAQQFEIPHATEITPRLIGGATLFGIGWGMAGYCPGPAIASVVTGSIPLLSFLGAMLVSMWLVKRLAPKENKNS